MALSLTRAGALNGSRIRSTADEIVGNDTTGALTAFLHLASASVFSTNVDATKVEAFDAHSAILDARAIKVHQAGGDAAEGLRAFDAQPDPWLVRRKAFEALWRDGSLFVYGAVNAGGMGAELTFGTFCVVVGNPASQADAIAVFPGDSAQRYCSAAGDVDRDGARREAVAWRDRGHAATIERADDVTRTLRPAWPWLICNTNRYLEAIIAPGPPLAAVDAVRMRGTYLNRLDDLTIMGSEDPLEAATEQRELHAIEAVRRWRDDHGVAMEVVR